MVNTTERTVMDPNYLLAQSNSLNRYASEILFIERTAKEVRSSLSDFRRDHPLSPPTLPWQIRYAIFIGMAWVFASFLLPEPVDDLIKRFRSDENNYGDSFSWEPVTLPMKIHDNWVIDETWIADNCEQGGEWKGTGIPNPRIERGIDQNSKLTFPNSSREEFAEVFCRIFGNTNQTTP